MSNIRKYAVARWDPTYKNCLSIVLPDSSLLLQTNNHYTRDQWYHSILWKVNYLLPCKPWETMCFQLHVQITILWAQRSIFKYQHLVSLNTQEEVIIRELKSMVDFALWTSLQDERVTAAPLEAVAKLFEDSEESEKTKEISQCQTDRKQWVETVFSVVFPLLDKVAFPACLAKVLVKLTEQYPRSIIPSFRHEPSYHQMFEAYCWLWQVSRDEKASSGIHRRSVRERRWRARSHKVHRFCSWAWERLSSSQGASEFSIHLSCSHFSQVNFCQIEVSLITERVNFVLPCGIRFHCNSYPDRSGGLPLSSAFSSAIFKSLALFSLLFCKTSI